MTRNQTSSQFHFSTNTVYIFTNTFRQNVAHTKFLKNEKFDFVELCCWTIIESITTIWMLRILVFFSDLKNPTTPGQFCGACYVLLNTLDRTLNHQFSDHRMSNTLSLGRALWYFFLYFEKGSCQSFFLHSVFLGFFCNKNCFKWLCLSTVYEGFSGKLHSTPLKMCHNNDSAMFAR
jgi:hypothetical protein